MIDLDHARYIAQAIRDGFPQPVESAVLIEQLADEVERLGSRLAQINAQAGRLPPPVSGPWSQNPPPAPPTGPGRSRK
jgi:hypothetical protein